MLMLSSAVLLLVTSEYQLVWIQIMPDILTGSNLFANVRNYLQATKVAHSRLMS